MSATSKRVYLTRDKIFEMIMARSWNRKNPLMTTRDGKLIFDGSRLVDFVPQDVEDDIAYNAAYVGIRYVVFNSSYWRIRASGMKAYRHISGADCIYRIAIGLDGFIDPYYVCQLLYTHMETVHMERMNREGVVSLWNEVCHDIGLGEHMPLPPNTGV